MSQPESSSESPATPARPLRPAWLGSAVGALVQWAWPAGLRDKKRKRDDDCATEANPDNLDPSLSDLEPTHRTIGTQTEAEAAPPGTHTEPEPEAAEPAAAAKEEEKEKEGPSEEKPPPKKRGGARRRPTELERLLVPHIADPAPKEPELLMPRVPSVTITHRPPPAEPAAAVPAAAAAATAAAPSVTITHRPPPAGTTAAAAAAAAAPSVTITHRPVAATATAAATPVTAAAPKPNAMKPNSPGGMATRVAQPEQDEEDEEEESSQQEEEEEEEAEEQYCGYCNKQIEAGQESRSCGVCHTPYHCQDERSGPYWGQGIGCRQRNGGCCQTAACKKRCFECQTPGSKVVALGRCKTCLDAGACWICDRPVTSKTASQCNLCHRLCHEGCWMREVGDARQCCQ